MKVRINKELKEMFDECKSYGDIFKTIGLAKKAGFSDEEVNLAASYRKNSFSKSAQMNFKKIPKIELNMESSNRYMTMAVDVKHLTSNKMTYTGSSFII